MAMVWLGVILSHIRGPVPVCLNQMLVDLDLEGLDAFESGASSSIGGGEFQVLTYPWPWGNDRAIVCI